jgi:CHAD domain-containing protein
MNPIDASSPEPPPAEGGSATEVAGSADDRADADPPDPPTAPAADLASDLLADGRTLEVSPDDPWPEAGRKVLRFHLGRMLTRVPGAIAGEDIEEVHAMRVAARRMRAAWRVFGDGFERDTVRRYREDLREVGGRLGAVRDLDVLIGIAAAYADHASARQREGLAPLVAAWDERREARRVELVELLESERFGRFVEEYVEFATSEDRAAIPAAAHAPRLVRHRMPSTAWAAYGAVWAFDDDLAEADLSTLHELRIAGKWLRYTLEFVRDPLQPEATELIRAAVALQDHIGTLHDLHVAATLARELVASRPDLSGRQVKAIDRFVRHLDQGAGRLRRTLPATWRPIVASDYRRRLGRALARL